MPLTSFASIPDDARVWVFASDRPLSVEQATPMLAEVDAYLSQWKAHGQPLRCAREWTDDRFLVIGIDPTEEQASGCSIDALFRHLREVEQAAGTRLVGGGRVFYRDVRGDIHCVTPAEFEARAERGEVTPRTTVFDTSITVARDWRTRFARPASESWTADLLAAS